MTGSAAATGGGGGRRETENNGRSRVARSASIGIVQSGLASFERGRAADGAASAGRGSRLA